MQINQHVGNIFFDYFFFLITYLGDGILGVIIVLLTYFVNVRLGIYVTLSFLFAAFSTNMLKYFFFQEDVRPYWIYQYVLNYNVIKVEGVDLLIKKSFPSGHATQAFALFFAFALSTPKQLYKLFFLFIAILGAFSRVYLSQHWLQDIAAGSIIGVFFSVLFYLIVFYKPSFSNLNKPLTHFIKR